MTLLEPMLKPWTPRWVVFLPSLLLAACGVREPPPAAPVEQKQAPEPAGAPAGEVEPFAVPAAEGPPEAEASSAPASLDKQEARGAERVSPQPAKPDGEAPAATMNKLAEAQVAFGEALEADTLSCDGARPRRDAICSIAERLCDRSHDFTEARKKNCREATEACDEARSRYREACEK